MPTPQPTNQPQKIFSLSELGTSLESVISRSYSGQYWIKAEIAKMNVYGRSGHCFLELVEKEGDATLAEMRAQIWKSFFEPLNKRFIEVTGEPLKDGLDILFQCKVKYHRKFGLSLDIQNIEPSYTLGEMARDKKATIARLQKEGLWDANRALPLPMLPKRLAIVSVETSKGYSDFIQIIEGNSSGYKFEHTLFPSLLQGDGAIPSMIKALNRVREASENFDVVCIIRGGGGDIGMSCYDAYDLAKTVAEFPIPVISGIGHSTNETVTEMVAHANKITPTDVGYFLVDAFRTLDERLAGMATLIGRDVRQLMARERQRLEVMSTGLKYTPRQTMAREKTHLEGQTQWLINYAQQLLVSEELKVGNFTNVVLAVPNEIIAGQHQRLQEQGRWLDWHSRQHLRTSTANLEQLASGLKYQPAQRTKSEANRLASLTKLLAVHTGQQLQNQSRTLDALDNQLKILHPDNVLKRGYSITLHNGKPVTEATALKPGDTITTQLHKGSADSEINEIHSSDE